MVADGDEREALRARADEVEKRIGIVNGGGVEKVDPGFREGSDDSDHYLSWNAAHVVGSTRPFHYSSRHAGLNPRN